MPSPEPPVRERGADSLPEQLRRWGKLRSLHPAAIDLDRVAIVRDAGTDRLCTPEATAQLVTDLGLNDEGLAGLPPHLHAHVGGLRTWQYPIQFGPYLHDVAGRGVRSYVEVGVRHGGSFVATIEVLRRSSPLELALGVDIIRARALERYAATTAGVRLAWLDSHSAAFAELLAELGPFDLAFIDAHHDEDECRRDVELLAAHADMIALHDVCHVGEPGVGRVWAGLVRSPDWECVEFVEQYAGLGPFMGIGLAVKPARRPSDSRLEGG